MKLIIPSLLMLIGSLCFGQCDRMFSPALSLSYGLVQKGKVGVQMEGGVWGVGTRLSLYGGFQGWQFGVSAKDSVGLSMAVYPHLRVGFVTYRDGERGWFNEASVSVSANPDVSYRICRRFGDNVLVGLVPKYFLKQRAGAIELMVMGSLW